MFFDADARLLHDLPAHGVLERLADFAETRDQRVVRQAAPRIAGEQQPLAVAHADNDRDRHVRVTDITAVRADHGAFVRLVRHRTAAGAAVLRVPVPHGEVVRRHARKRHPKRLHGAKRAGAAVSKRVRLPGRVRAEEKTAPGDGKTGTVVRLGKRPAGPSPAEPAVSLLLQKNLVFAEGHYVVLGPGRARVYSQRYCSGSILCSIISPRPIPEKIQCSRRTARRRTPRKRERAAPSAARRRAGRRQPGIPPPQDAAGARRGRPPPARGGAARRTRVRRRPEADLENAVPGVRNAPRRPSVSHARRVAHPNVPQ